MKGQMNYENIEEEENILNLGHIKINNKTALMLSHACRTILEKGHIRDRILEPANVEEVWEIANHAIWLNIWIFAWAMHNVA